MKSLKLLTLASLTTTTLLSSASFAVNPRILTASSTMYGSSQLNFYTGYAPGALMGVATEFCKSFGEQVESISNIVVQAQAKFTPDGPSNLKTQENPQMNFSGLVNCQPAAR